MWKCKHFSRVLQMPQAFLTKTVLQPYSKYEYPFVAIAQNFR